MKKIIAALILISALLSYYLLSKSHADVNSKEQNFTQSLISAPLSATTTFAITDTGFLSAVSLHFSTAPSSAETIKVYRHSRAGANFDTLIASYTTTAGSTTDVSFMVGNAVPIAETDQVKVTCTNVSGGSTVYVSVVLDTSPRGSGGITVYDNGVLRSSGLQHDYRWHSGDVIPDANQAFGAYYSDFTQLATPADPASGTRRLFVDSGTNKMSVRTSAGTTQSLEEAGHVIEDEGTPLTQETNLNFTGAGVTCTDSGSKTVCDIPTPPGGGDNVSVNGTAATSADFDDTTPAAPAGGVNVFWQKDASAPDNISAYVKFATASLNGAVSTAAQTLAGSKTLTDTLVLDNQKDLRFNEGTAGGTNYVALLAPATLASNRTCTLQDAAAPIPDSCVGDGTDSGITSETDPTLTNDGAVTIGDGSTNPTVLTFNSDAGTDGTLSYNGTTDTLLTNALLGVSSSSTSTVRLGQRLGVDNSANYGGAAFTTWSAGNADHSALFEFNRSASSTPGTYTAVADNYTLGAITFRGSDGSAFVNGATIQGQVDGTPGANDMPSVLRFLTSPDGSAVPAERLSIGPGTEITALLNVNIDNQKSLKLSEANANGTSAVTFTAPAALTADRTCVFEDDANPIPDSCVGDGTDANSGDPWTYLYVTGSDFTTTSGTAVTITGLSFTPADSSRYEIKGQLLRRTATNTVGARAGVGWPTAGVTDGVAFVRCTDSAATETFAGGNFNAAVACGNTGLPDTTGSWPAEINATLVTTTGVTSTFRATMFSETAGTTVTVKVGSWLAYRTF